MPDIKEQLFNLNKMSKKSVALYHGFALSIGISDSALGVLYSLLDSGDSCSQNDLCAEWSIPKQTVNTAVNALQKKGLIALTHSTGAKNRKNILLTPTGKIFAENTVARLQAAEFSALSELTDEERELFVRLNEKYNKALIANLRRVDKGENDR